MGRRREERVEKMLCCVQSENEKREKQCVIASVSFCVSRMCVCSSSCVLIDSHTR